MGYPDGYYYGQGRIICDTSNFSVGDTIRVRSMTDSNKVWNQQVATVGTALVFTVPCYDYYKICTVQDIGGVLTEIGGVYKTVDYGQTLFIDNMLDLSTLRGIQGILNAHQESSQLAIGDEVDIIVNGNPWTMQIAGINVYHDHDIMFTSKRVYNQSGNNYSDYRNSSVRQQAQAFYSAIGDNDKQYIKEVTRKCWISSPASAQSYDDYCFVLGNKEVFGGADYSSVSDQVQMPLFVTQANRVKTYNGTAYWYYTSDYYYSSQVVIVRSDGTIGVSTSNGGGVVPSFMLIADS